ncbi:unnamed protein product [Spirodela intermedia]|uniref:Homeobox domain-containing protein n=1 Tax=Spirodela intermedia TaxID=51605 RepID=A0A7I8IMB2_SPIIN|nr:unnamed protein product [Spirodela intermedia]CAA6658938.1 unnamed protein product [Spirodela intermedia]
MTTVHQKDPGHTPYQDFSLPGSILYSENPPPSSYPNSMVYYSRPQHISVQLPAHSGGMPLEEPTVGRSEFASPRTGEIPSDTWKIGRNELFFMQTVGGGPAPLLGSMADRRSSSLESSNISGIRGQGLSLSLGTEIPMPSFHYRPSSEISFAGSHQSSAENGLPSRDDRSRDKGIAEASPYGIQNLVVTISGSRYLKAAQHLLDEVVNIHGALKNNRSKRGHPSLGTPGRRENDWRPKGEEPSANPAPELSATERQDLQNKMSKLMSMLDEVDRKYKHYHHQMQIVVSSFDALLGSGPHFRSLRDAINGQISATRKSLGEQDPLSIKAGGMARLRCIDQQIRDQRAFQQFGSLQQPPQQAWRPQRGLPETAVSILRAWLFEHFLHPYPKDSDKLMLARQTRLTRSQVSNWFINARVRLWKPMIEEMYEEELKDAEMNSNSQDGDGGRDNAARSSELVDDNAARDGVVAGSSSVGRPQPFTDDCDLLQEEALTQTDVNSRYMVYEMEGLGGGAAGGSVSLTLGLRHTDGGPHAPAADQRFAPIQGDAADYDCLNIVDRRHRFGSFPLLHDFVA